MNSMVVLDCCPKTRHIRYTQTIYSCSVAQTSQETVTSTVQTTGSASTATNTSASVNPSTAAQESNVVDEEPPLGMNTI